MFVRTTTHANEEGQLFTRFRPSSWPDVKSKAFEERRVPFIGPVEYHLHKDVVGRANVGSGEVQRVGLRSRAKETSIVQPFNQQLALSLSA